MRRIHFPRARGTGYGGRAGDSEGSPVAARGSAVRLSVREGQ
jgi:hypothetical protein